MGGSEEMRRSTAAVTDGESGWVCCFRGPLTVALCWAKNAALSFVLTMGRRASSSSVSPGGGGPSRPASVLADSCFNVFQTMELGVSRLKEPTTRAHDSVRAAEMACLSSRCLAYTCALRRGMSGEEQLGEEVRMRLWRREAILFFSLLSCVHSSLQW